MLPTIKQKLQQEIRSRMLKGDLEDCQKLAELDLLIYEIQNQPEKFFLHWVAPLLAAGLDLDRALALVVECNVSPN